MDKNNEEENTELTPPDIAEILSELFDGVSVELMIEGVSFYLGKALNDSLEDLMEEHEDPIQIALDYLIQKIIQRTNQIATIYKKRGES